MFEQYGFIAPRSGLAGSAAEAARLAAEIGFPVALKIASPDILHKTDIGGVELGLRTPAEVEQSFTRILAAVRAVRPEARIEGVEVQEMVTRGTEIIIGLLDDPQFGPVIMFGLGGIFTEVLGDVSFRVVPIDRTDALQMIRETKGYEVLKGYRGQPPVSEEMLVDLLMNASRMGAELGGRLESADFNPIVVWEDQHRVLDCKIIWHPEPRPAPSAPPPDTRWLDGFFEARSVAVVGASATPGKVGYFVLDSLVNHEYAGRVFPVNPGRAEIMGVSTYPTLEAIPEKVELAVVVVGLDRVPDLIEGCARLGIHNMVIVSGGGKELGGDKVDLEAEIRRRARERGVRVIGPNCIGVFDGRSRLDTFFQVHDVMIRPKAGRVAVLTQSGTVGCALLEHLAAVGVSRFVSYGNRTDVDEADLLAYLAGDEQTDIIAMYIEGLEDGRKFLNVAQDVARKKPVVVFKVGRTERAARASMSHTGFFGGSYGVVQGAFRQAGLIAVDSYDELLAVTKALALQPKARGPRVSMISNGAGTMVQGIDLLRSYSLEIHELAPQTVERLTRLYPSYYIVQNPIDVTGSATSTDYEVGIEALMNDPNVDIVMPWFVFQDTPLEEDIVDRLARLNREYDKPILVGAMGGPYTARMSQAIEQVGIPVFHSIRDWIAAAQGLYLSSRPDVSRSSD